MSVSKSAASELLPFPQLPRELRTYVFNLLLYPDFDLRKALSWRLVSKGWRRAVLHLPLRVVFRSPKTAAFNIGILHRCCENLVSCDVSIYPPNIIPAGLLEPYATSLMELSLCCHWYPFCDSSNRVSTTETKPGKLKIAFPSATSDSSPELYNPFPQLRTLYIRNPAGTDHQRLPDVTARKQLQLHNLESLFLEREPTMAPYVSIVSALTRLGIVDMNKADTTNWHLMTKMRALMLSNVSLRGDWNNILRTFRNLYEIAVIFCIEDSISIDVLASLPHLRRVTLVSTSKASPLTKDINELTKLRNIEFLCSHLKTREESDTGLLDLSAFPRLTAFGQLNYSKPHRFHTPNLQALVRANSSWHEWFHCENLRHLHFQHTAFSYFYAQYARRGADAVLSLSSLQSLAVSDPFPFSCVPTCVQSLCIYLSRTYPSGPNCADLSPLVRLPNLTYLQIQEAPRTETCFPRETFTLLTQLRQIFLTYDVQRKFDKSDTNLMNFYLPRAVFKPLPIFDPVVSLDANDLVSVCQQATNEHITTRL